MIKKMMILIIVSSMIGTNCFFAAADTVDSIEDPVDDVLFIKEDAPYSKTNEKPNIDIIKVTFERKKNSKMVTLTLEVNERGFIEDRNDFENIDPNSTSFTGVLIVYSISLETDINFYQIEYTNKSCTVNYEYIVDYLMVIIFSVNHLI